MQRDVDSLCEWADKWQMEFNVSKCKTMHLGAKNSRHKYEMKGYILESVLLERDLGVSVSSDMKVLEQCDQACKKANRMLGLLRRTISSREPQLLVSLYKTLVRPHLEYCCPAWSPFYKKDKEKLERVQHRFTRFFNTLKTMSYECRLKCLSLWSLEERRNRADLLEVFKMSHGLSSIPLESLFTLEKDPRTRDHSLKLKKQQSRTDLRHHFFSNRVVNRWNKLPSEAVEVTYTKCIQEHLGQDKENTDGLFHGRKFA